MITAANLRFQDFQFQVQTLTGFWRWTTRVDVSGSAPIYQVKDIVAPTGILRDTVPIPGEVIQAMSASIDQIQQNFPPAILLGPPSSLTFTVDEGRGFSSTQSVTVTNSGVYGSLLNIGVSTSAVYVTATPANIGNLASNEVGSFAVAVDSTSLLASSSPYTASVTAQDPTASNNPRTYPITIVVRPKATVACSPIEVDFTAPRPIVGSFDPVPTQTFSIQNTGLTGSVLDFQIRKLTNLSNWLVGFSPVSGTLGASASQVITVLVAPPDGMLAGVYQETLRVSGYSTNSFVDVLVQLTVT